MLAACLSHYSFQFHNPESMYQMSLAPFYMSNPSPESLRNLPEVTQLGHSRIRILTDRWGWSSRKDNTKHGDLGVKKLPEEV